MLTITSHQCARQTIYLTDEWGLAHVKVGLCVRREPSSGGLGVVTGGFLTRRRSHGDHAPLVAPTDYIGGHLIPATRKQTQSKQKKTNKKLKVNEN